MLKIKAKTVLLRSVILGLTLLVCNSVQLQASDTQDSSLNDSVSIDSLRAEEHDSKKFNAGEVIIHHVLDANEIHIMDGLAFPLPIILYTAQGIDVFSFSRFWNEHHEPEAVYTSASTGNSYVYHHGHVTQINEHHEEIAHAGWSLSHHSFLDLSITKNVVGIFFGGLLMIILFITVARSYATRGVSAPKGIQSFMEVLIMFVRDEVAKPSIGKKYERFMPFLLTVFFFIWIGNLLGLVPFLGGLNITGNIAVTAVLAIFTFLVTSFSANKGYWMHIISPPGVPKWLLPIMLPIEILGVFNKPIVLCLRLFANITAGHIIILSFTCLIFIFNASSGAAVAYGVSIGSVLFSVFMLTLELLVAFLQAYVFTLLSALYFGQAVEEPDHH